MLLTIYEPILYVKLGLTIVTSKVYTKNVLKTPN